MLPVKIPKTKKFIFFRLLEGLRLSLIIVQFFVTACQGIHKWRNKALYPFIGGTNAPTEKENLCRKQRLLHEDKLKISIKYYIPKPYFKFLFTNFICHKFLFHY